MRRIAPLLATAALVVAPLQTLAWTSPDEPALVDGMIDEEAECPGFVPGITTNPQDIDVNPLDDDEVSIRVLVMVQGSATTGQVRQLIEPAIDMYDRIGMSLSLSFQTMGGAATGEIDADAFIAETRSAVGGRRPAGFDAVIGMTTKELAGSTAGKVECVGGYAHPELAFGVSEIHLDDLDEGGIHLTPRNSTAVIFAHELLHLFGAHHHYANCAQSRPDPLNGALGVCTIMINDIGLASFVPSTANQRIARGYEANYRDGS